jgi:hypothetical protein
MAFSRTHLVMGLEDEDGLPVIRIFRIVRQED